MNLKEGPTIYTKRSCKDCKWLEWESCRTRIDDEESGFEYYYAHPKFKESLARRKYIGTTETPRFCPFLSDGEK